MSAARLFAWAGLVELLRRPAAARRSAATTRTAAVSTSAQHPKIARHNFKTRPFLALFVLPFTRLNAALDKNQRTLLQILLRDFRLLAPHHNLVPLRALLPFTVLVFVGLVRCHGKIGHSLPAARIPRLRVPSQASHQNHFIH